MTITQLTGDLAYLALTTLGDVAIMAAGGLIVLALLDGLVSAVQLIRN